jgi:hypothetical protein
MEQARKNFRLRSNPAESSLRNGVIRFLEHTFEARFLLSGSDDKTGSAVKKRRKCRAIRLIDWKE